LWVDPRKLIKPCRNAGLFCVSLLLYNDVPMEIVSQLLGHSSITITEDSYGKVIQKKVSEQMSKLNDKLNE